MIKKENKILDLKKLLIKINLLKKKKRRIDNDLSLYLGSLDLCQSVESIGNSTFVNKNKLIKTIKYSVI